VLGQPRPHAAVCEDDGRVCEQFARQWAPHGGSGHANGLCSSSHAEAVAGTSQSAGGMVPESALFARSLRKRRRA
jgi:hypothetical protein